MNEPETDVGDEYILKAFCDLDTCRQYSGGAIPWNIIVQYIDGLGLDADIANAIEEVIRIMDIAYLKILDKENNKPIPKKKVK